MEATVGDRFRKLLAEGPIICAEGYIFALERAGYCCAGPFVPIAVLEDPQVVRQIHKDFVRSGSDVVLALTYYGHREKMRLIGKENLLETLNKEALKIAKEVAKECEEKYKKTILVAGNLSNTNLWDANDVENSKSIITPIFEEQVRWAVEAGVDFFLGETFGHVGEALLALEIIKKISPNMPTVINTIASASTVTRDGFNPVETIRQLEKAGADVAGFNCHRGPATMLPILKEVFAADPPIKIPIATVPVPYRTTAENPTFTVLKDTFYPKSKDSDRPFPVALDPFTCNRYEIEDFTKEASKLGVKYFGLCCGASPHHVRSMAEALGRTPEASKYSPDMSKHFALGTDPSLKASNKAGPNNQY